MIRKLLGALAVHEPDGRTATPAVNVRRPAVSPAVATAVRTTRTEMRRLLRELAEEVELRAGLEVDAGAGEGGLGSGPDYYRITIRLHRLRELLSRYIWSLGHDVLPLVTRGTGAAETAPTQEQHAANEFELLSSSVVRPFLERYEVRIWTDELKRSFAADLPDVLRCCERIFKLETGVFLPNR